MMEQYNSFMGNLNKDDMERVGMCSVPTHKAVEKLFFSPITHPPAQMQPEIHATSSSLKSLVTNIAYDAIDDLRRCCGGHGYSTFANVSNSDYGMMVTGEGDNYMVCDTGLSFCCFRLTSRCITNR